MSLRGRADFQRLWREGRRRRVGEVTVVSACGGPGSPRVAVVAGRAVGGAVLRNRAKRRLREAVAQAPLRSDRDYVVIGGEGLGRAPFSLVRAWVVAAVEEVR